MENGRLLLLRTTVFILSTIPLSTCKDLNIPCDINSRNETCPDDYCCVRDEFLYTETYCKQYGRAGNPCGTKPSEFECSCEDGFRCASNIHGHITSLFGKCFPIPGYDMTTDGALPLVTSDNGGNTKDPQTVDMETTTGLTQQSGLTPTKDTTEPAVPVG